MIDTAVIADTLELLGRMAPDPVNMPGLLAYLAGGGDVCELRTLLRAQARERQPRRYLEIGVRRGWSLAQVLAECPGCRCVGIDAWVPDYAGAPNEGARWLRAELRRVGLDLSDYRLMLISGRSQDVLARRRLGRFDLICVDGDHTGAGALADLRLCLPMVAPGGVLVFDDLLPLADAPGLTLRQAWETAQAETTGFTWREVAGLTPMGLAVRNA